MCRLQLPVQGAGWPTQRVIVLDIDRLVLPPSGPSIVLFVLILQRWI